MAETKRGQILEQGINLTEGDRNKSYGHPQPNLTCFARLVGAYLDGLPRNRGLDSTDGAILMVLAKVSRVAANKAHPDNYVDMATYAAIAGECSEINGD